MKKNFVKEYLSIPNLLGYFRILLLPFYLYVYLNAELFMITMWLPLLCFCRSSLIL